MQLKLQADCSCPLKTWVEKGAEFQGVPPLGTKSYKKLHQHPVPTTAAINSSKSSISDISYKDLSCNDGTGSGLRAYVYQSSNGMQIQWPLSADGKTEVYKSHTGYPVPPQLAVG